MRGSFRLGVIFAVVLAAALAVHAPHAFAVAVGTVTISPNVVPVPANPAQKTAVLISAALSGVPAGTTVSCTVTLTLLPSNAVLAVSPAVNTSPAPASGATSMTLQMLVPGGTAAGRAQATANCGASSGFTLFRITSLVGLSVAPPVVPAGGATGITVMIAGAGPLPSTPCTLIVTAPAGAAPPLAVQAVTVSGGAATVPASTLVTMTVPNTAPLGNANASVSCVISGSGTSGDSTDFTITDPSVATVLAVLSQAVGGSNLTVTAVTLPGFVCVALLSPAAGARLQSAPATADATGTVVETIPLPTNLQPGPATLTVTCADPANPANIASSAALNMTVLGAAAVGGVTASGCAGLTAGGAVTGPTPAAMPGGQYAGGAGQRVQFSGSGSLPSTGAVLTTCIWSFGDGERGTMLTPSHTYAAAGVYSVSLTVSDSAGLSTTATTTAVIAPFIPLCSQPSLTGLVWLGICVVGAACPATSLPGECIPPCQTYAPANALAGGRCPQPGIVVQALTGGPYSGQTSQPLTFQGSASAVGTRRVCAPDATLGTEGPFCNLVPAVDLPSPVTYLWDFGDGGFANSAGATHTYSGPGSYRVTLTVAFDDGSVAVGSTLAQISGAVTDRPFTDASSAA